MSRHTANPISIVPLEGPEQENGPLKRQLPDELAAWRTVHPASVPPTILDALQEALIECEPPTRRRSWQDALGGDAAAAIRVAIVVSGLCEPFDGRTDAAASMLLVHALRGDAAAAATLSCMLRIHNARLPGDVRLACLADAWRYGWANLTADCGVR